MIETDPQTFYIRRSDGAYVSFEGFAQDKIQWLLGEQNLQCEFIDKETYDAAIGAASNRP